MADREVQIINRGCLFGFLIAVLLLTWAFTQINGKL